MGWSPDSDNGVGGKVTAAVGQLGQLGAEEVRDEAHVRGDQHERGHQQQPREQAPIRGHAANYHSQRGRAR